MQIHFTTRNRRRNPFPVKPVGTDPRRGTGERPARNPGEARSRHADAASAGDEAAAEAVSYRQRVGLRP